MLLKWSKLWNGTTMKWLPRKKKRIKLTKGIMKENWQMNDEDRNIMILDSLMKIRMMRVSLKLNTRGKALFQMMKLRFSNVKDPS